MSRNVIVIGGVALGPKAASRLKRLDPTANVTMIDENINISFGGCGIPYYVSGEINSLDALRSTTYGTVRTPEYFEHKGVHTLNQTRVTAIDRAHFYPEKHMMTLELVVERGTRRVLGIQGVCEDGDALKARIDAVATMLQFGKPTIDDLANAEIAYAPPFASAMDAVNAVANVADNILSGQLKPISSKEFGELWKDRANNNVFFADARPAVAGNATAAKYPGEWHAIALEDIEAKFDSIPKDRPVALVCNTGLRSYEVMLDLHNHGVTDVVNALGGMQALIKRGDNM